jgi:exodeoxyribonuclease VII small subunit
MPCGVVDTFPAFSNMPKKKRPQTEVAEGSFEESLAALEAIVGELESGSLGLAEALACYQQGVRHLKTCQKLLERAERKIELLSGVDAAGNPIARPLDEEALDSLEEKASARSRRRTSDASVPGVKSASRERNVDDGHHLF